LLEKKLIRQYQELLLLEWLHQYHLASGLVLLQEAEAVVEEEQVVAVEAQDKIFL
jgi:hypothetical protein